MPHYSRPRDIEPFGCICGQHPEGAGHSAATPRVLGLDQQWHAHYSRCRTGGYETWTVCAQGWRRATLEPVAQSWIKGSLSRTWWYLRHCLATAIEDKFASR